MKEEVINMASECIEPCGNLLKHADSRARRTGRCLRPCGICLLIVGFIALFIPLLALSIPYEKIGSMLGVAFFGGGALACVLGWNIGAFMMMFSWARFNLLPSS